jgi:hypothetical protein
VRAEPYIAAWRYPSRTQVNILGKGKPGIVLWQTPRRGDRDRLEDSSELSSSGGGISAKNHGLDLNKSDLVSADIK